MTTRRSFMLTSGAALLAGLTYRATMAAPAAAWEVTRTDAEWRARLTAAQYEVLRKRGTERPFSSPLYKEHRAGKFACAACENPLFSSKNKFDSGTGWPSFWKPLERGVYTSRTTSLGMYGVEVVCRRCGSHLGDVFDDGPEPTGLRYCIDGVALNFVPGEA
ncbi:peptide-methionine (R)-S-oxide reductase MsrB [Duganella sp.]|uniref:peptide-methionine (R)-S-oxide reductase MsrB n=1 Tax=Duganella sp. TaxID=1904440 RepID=UPI0031D9B235